jgi:hypothetical protein
MKKREMIIVGVALLAGAYALLDYTVLSRPSSVKSEAVDREKQSALGAFVQSAQARLAVFSGTDDNRVRQIIARAEAPWESDPFEALPTAGPVAAEQGQAVDTGVELRYTGYIRAGTRELAVINGMEYHLGDSLLDLGYRVVSITPERVVLVTEASAEIILPLEEN